MLPSCDDGSRRPVLPPVFKVGRGASPRPAATPPPRPIPTRQPAAPASTPTQTSTGAAPAASPTATPVSTAESREAAATRTETALESYVDAKSTWEKEVNSPGARMAMQMGEFEPSVDARTLAESRSEAHTAMREQFVAAARDPSHAATLLDEADGPYGPEQIREAVARLIEYNPERGFDVSLIGCATNLALQSGEG